MRIAFFGDSLVNGTRDEKLLGWPGRLCRAEIEIAGREGGPGRDEDFTYYNLGARSETTDGLRLRWRQEADIRKAKPFGLCLVFSAGTADCVPSADGPRVTPAKSAENFKTILEEGLVSSNGLVLAVSPPPVQADILRAGQAEIVAKQAQVAKELKVPYLDVFTPLSIDPAYLGILDATDGIHPTGDGYAMIAKLVGEWKEWREWWDQ